MLNGRPELLLIDLPTFPKGTIALSLFAVAASLSQRFEVKYLDINLKNPDDVLDNIQSEIGNPAVVGLKVSAQNFSFAKKLSARIKKVLPLIKIVWGGEFPTLMPEECLLHCDTIVKERFETVASQFGNDLLNGGLKQVYQGTTPQNIDFDWTPDFSIIKNPEDYFGFMGIPFETSRGCDKKCVFCMVGVMQKNYMLKSKVHIEKELKSYKGKYVNVIDYNIGVETQHVINVSHAMKKAGVAGWMAEMCLESLDNDEMLASMRDSGCRMVYCGLESLDEEALRSVNKANTNHIDNYERIVRKAQSYGIQVGTGLILGLKGMNEDSFKKTYDFFHRIGIIYTKMTFLTYNPGTKVHTSMKKMGDYSVEEYEYFDGNHLSYIPKDVSIKAIYNGADWYIRNFYNPWKIILRSFNAHMSFLRRLEFILFGYCFGEAYRQWLREDIFNNEAGFRKLLMNPYRKNRKIKFAERLLSWLRSSG